MKNYLWIIALFCVSISYGQTFKSPACKRSNKSIAILKIEITKERTIFTLKHTNPHPYYGFVRIMPDAYIQINGKGKKLYILEAEGVPFYPKVFNYGKKGDTKTFKLYFPTIPKKTKSIKMIEIEEEDKDLHPDSSGGFNFTKIWLTPVA
jgi:hypothetical protein